MCGLKISRVAESLSLLGMREYGDHEHRYSGLEVLNSGLSSLLGKWMPFTDTTVSMTCV